MKKTRLIAIPSVVAACVSSAWGLAIHANISPKSFTPEWFVKYNHMYVDSAKESFNVSGTQGDVEAKLYKGETDVFYFTDIMTYTGAPDNGVPTLVCEDVTVNITGSTSNHWLRIAGGNLNATNTVRRRTPFRCTPFAWAMSRSSPILLNSIKNMPTACGWRSRMCCTSRQCAIRPAGSCLRIPASLLKSFFHRLMACTCFPMGILRSGLSVSPNTRTAVAMLPLSVDPTDTQAPRGLLQERHSLPVQGS